MPYSSPDTYKKSSGKSHPDSCKQHDGAAETARNVGCISHRQAWAERKKKKSRDKVSWPSSLQSFKGVLADMNDHDTGTWSINSWDSGCY
jgi:hypothetical protein